MEPGIDALAVRFGLVPASAGSGGSITAVLADALRRERGLKPGGARSGGMRIAFYAPLKAPDHPIPSGDRRVGAAAAWALAVRRPRRLYRFAVSQL